MLRGAQHCLADHGVLSQRCLGSRWFQNFLDRKLEKLAR